jgi:hypothetical protein
MSALQKGKKPAGTNRTGFSKSSSGDGLGVADNCILSKPSDGLGLEAAQVVTAPKEPKKPRLEVTDRDGKIVTMSEKSWRHMLFGHPEMAQYEDEICLTISDPDFIVRSPQAPVDPSGERRVACRYEPTIRRSRPYLYVPIEYSGRGNWVPSAYLDPFPPKGEALFVRLIAHR